MIFKMRFYWKFVFATISVLIICLFLLSLVGCKGPLKEDLVCGKAVQVAPLKENRMRKDGRHSPEGFDCVINGEYQVSCLRDGSEVYFPFSFLKNYFEVYGKIVSEDGEERFEWFHSYSKIYHPKGKYDPKGVFMYFDNYNVEVRERVKCITASEGVPVSTQWEPRGYFYPIQIAQFGLAHYSKYIAEAEPNRLVLEDGDRTKALWFVADGASFTRKFLTDINNFVIEFNTQESLNSKGIELKLSESLTDFILNLNLKFESNGSVEVIVEDKEKKSNFHLFYVCSDLWITSKGNKIFHGLGDCNSWRRLTRDLLVDLQKGQSLSEKGKRILRSRARVTAVIFRGVGYADNITLSSSEHLAHFYDAADWFVKHQDDEGGWPIDVKRHLGAGVEDLDAGWYSAMGQGQAMSLLMRAYYSSRNEYYLSAALDAVKPFQALSEDHGVKAVFMDKYIWFEEYPTQPSSFVLNGFIYSLIGLYDVAHAPDSMGSEARDLYIQGIRSLKAMLLLYDTGSGTLYDLRHITAGGAPNVARWDYHSTHVNQLLLLSTIESDPVFATTAKRWQSYMNGKRAPHN
ncbi:D-glucuronyl C5-epimerase B-like isoform X2 [Artemia franciscana]|uniref:D-glucuronyl C5-epimerase B-like isoform X2 n=1 Tax=Artemia franciscana TaxID=6661 RepID=UPI0032DAA7A3